MNSNKEKKLFNPFDKWATQYESDIIKLQNNYPFAGYFDIVNIIENAITKYAIPKLLDLGIGSGFMINKLKSKVNFEISGIDSSNQMLALASHIIKKEMLIYWDISNKEIPKQLLAQSFDIIISTFTLHHFDNEVKLEIIKRYINLLSEEGTFIIADICFSNKIALDRVRNEVGDRWDDDEGDYYFEVNIFLVMLRKLYKVEYTKISFCTGVFMIQKL